MWGHDGSWSGWAFAPPFWGSRGHTWQRSGLTPDTVQEPPPAGSRDHTGCQGSARTTARQTPPLRCHLNTPKHLCTENPLVSKGREQLSTETPSFAQGHKAHTVLRKQRPPDHQRKAGLDVHPPCRTQPGLFSAPKEPPLSFWQMWLLLLWLFLP